MSSVSGRPREQVRLREARVVQQAGAADGPAQAGHADLALPGEDHLDLIELGSGMLVEVVPPVGDAAQLDGKACGLIEEGARRRLGDGDRAQRSDPGPRQVLRAQLDLLAGEVPHAHEHRTEFRAERQHAASGCAAVARRLHEADQSVARLDVESSHRLHEQRVAAPQSQLQRDRAPFLSADQAGTVTRALDAPRAALGSLLPVVDLDRGAAPVPPQPKGRQWRHQHPVEVGRLAPVAQPRPLRVAPSSQLRQQLEPVRPRLPRRHVNLASRPLRADGQRARLHRARRPAVMHRDPCPQLFHAGQPRAQPVPQLDAVPVQQHPRPQAQIDRRLHRPAHLRERIPVAARRHPPRVVHDPFLVSETNPLGVLVAGTALIQLEAGERRASIGIVHGDREPVAPAVADSRLEFVGGRHQQRSQIELHPATTRQSPTPRERAPIGGRSPHPHLRVRRLARGSYLQRVAPSRIERQRCVGPRWRSSVEADAERSVIHVSPRPLHQGAHPERVQGVRQLGIRPGRASPRPGSSEAFAFRPGTPELHAAPEGPPQRYRVQPCDLLYDSLTAPVSEWAPRSVLPSTADDGREHRQRGGRHPGCHGGPARRRFGA